MSKNNKHIGLLREYIVKCRMDKYMGKDMESVVISTYHTHIISATSQALAKQEAAVLVSAKLEGDGKVVVESCTEGI